MKQFVVRAVFQVEGTWTVDAETDDEALSIAEERARDMGPPGFSLDSEELDFVDIEEVRE